MKRFLLLCSSLFIFHSSLFAVPAWPGLLRMVQPDGTVVECRLVGDEHGHAFLTTDGVLMQLDDQQVLRPARGSRAMMGSPRKAIDHIDETGRTAFPTTGDVRGLVLLVEFADNSFHESHTPELFHEMMNGDDYTYEGATGSSASYFRDQSMGLFRPQFDVVGPVKLTRNVNFYGQNIGMTDDAYAQEMVAEACLQADTLYNVDFTRYDNDGDGKVDFVYVFYAGYGESYGAPSYTIWPHQGELTTFGVNCVVDGLTVDRYACSCELKYTTGSTIEGIGTFCHEFGHVLGLPDLYQTNGGTSHFLATWDIMDVGCYNNNSHTPPCYSAFERYCMNWLEFTDIDQPATGLQLPNLATQNKAYRLSSPNEKEYFLLENRQAEGWDAAIGGHGMLITHIDFERSIWQINAVNNNTTHPRVTIVAADGSASITPEGDAFPGTTGKSAFTDNTSPASTLWNGSPLGRSVSSIHEADGLITFSFMQDKLATPQLLPPEDVTNTSFVARWTPIDNAAHYTLTVKALLPDSVRPVPVVDDFSLMTEGDYMAKNNPAATGRMDSLTQQPGWSGEELYAANGYVQIGRYGVSGQLTTPTVVLAAADEGITIVCAWRAYANRSVNYDLVVTDAETGLTIDSLRGKATAQLDTLIRRITTASRQLRVTLRSNRERLFVDQVRIVRGCLTDEEALVAANPELCLQGITESSHTVTALTPATTYRFWVQAITGDPLYDSEVSQPLTVTLLDAAPSAISQMDGDTQTVTVYTLSGQLVYSGPAHTTPQLHGLLIVRQGSKTAKRGTNSFH